MPSAVPKGESIDQRFRVIVTALYVVMLGSCCGCSCFRGTATGMPARRSKEFNVVSAALRAMADVSSDGDDLPARVSCDIGERQITPALPPSMGITAPLT